MAFAAVYDACVLYPSVTRDVLVRTAITGMVRAHWSQAILDEVSRNLLANRPDIPPEKHARMVELMNSALPAAVVTGYEDLIEAFRLPDPDDRHVLAVAVKAGAQLIVTENLRDFPDEALVKYDIEAKGADDVLVDQFHISSEAMTSIVEQLSASWTGRPATEEVLARIERAGLLQFAALLRS